MIYEFLVWGWLAGGAIGAGLAFQEIWTEAYLEGNTLIKRVAVFFGWTISVWLFFWPIVILRSIADR